MLRISHLWPLIRRCLPYEAGAPLPMQQSTFNRPLPAPSLPPLQDKGADTSSAVEREDLLEMARKMESGAGDK